MFKKIFFFYWLRYSAAKNQNKMKFKRFKNIALRKLLNDPLYISNYAIHSGLKFKIVHKEEKIYYKHYHNYFTPHNNTLVLNYKIPFQEIFLNVSNVNGVVIFLFPYLNRIKFCIVKKKFNLWVLSMDIYSYLSYYVKFTL